MGPARGRMTSVQDKYGINTSSSSRSLGKHGDRDFLHPGPQAPYHRFPTRLLLSCDLKFSGRELSSVSNTYN